MPYERLETLQVIGVRYRNSTLAENDERSLDAYINKGVYADAGVPFEVIEPQMPPVPQSNVETENIGVLGGEIANAVADARSKGAAILMTGGNCTHITGIFGGLQDAHGPSVRVGLIWFDAHGDFNTPGTSLSGMLGGMPVAVCAGLAFPTWRERSHIVAPVPTDRILMVDVRNLDEPEAALVDATDIVIAAPAVGFAGVELATAVDQLAARCDLLYLHIDSDILDERYTPNHSTKEPDGPDMDQVKAAIDTVMATGKVAVAAVVSVYGEGEGSEIMVESGIELIRGCLTSWQTHGGAWSGESSGESSEAWSISDEL